MTPRIETEAPPCPFTLSLETAAPMLRKRAEDAEQEGTMIALVDAGYFGDAARLIEELRAQVQDLGTEGHAYREGKLAGHRQAAADRDLVIDHLGDLLAHQMAETERWRQVALDGLTRANGHKRELAALRAAVFGSTDYAADLTNGNFVEMAQALHAAQRGALARAEAAEAELAAARAEIERLRARLEDRIHDY